MNYVDIVLAVLLALGMYRGFKKGLIISIFGMLALFVGIYGGVMFADQVAEVIGGWLDEPKEWLPFAAFAATFLAIVVAIYLLGKMVTKAMNVTMLGLPNKIGGAVFGLLRTALVISVLLLFVHPLIDKKSLIPIEQRRTSILYNPMHEFAQTVVPTITDSDFYDYLRNQKWIPGDDQATGEPA
jgi:membrane protein required for colicin V production